ncbi:MAG: hypothetical protein F4Z10_08240 [Synechococcus sp. SB0666_bin_14]|nr:hypothetical protein [Synechococcus sp. SB0666_bin_14]MYA90495.1 hypothetical protein [Synechococcus sp. SB0663_bin_10]MYG46961.1 hypothetical protein [Synechococcus sp. SB0675_bin_6]MYK91991.1 hypothetical protein [Synechococcus sp. SB0669_bin_8]
MSDSYPWDQYPLQELEERGIVSLGRGKIISKVDIQENPGDYPIYSSSAKGEGLFGKYDNYMFDEELITWPVDGGGHLFYRPRHRFSVTNVSEYMRLDTSVFDYRFVHAILSLQHSKLTFDYQAKAHPSVIRNIYHLPFTPLPEQKKIAEILSGIDRRRCIYEVKKEKIFKLIEATINHFFVDIASTAPAAEIGSFGMVVTGSTPPTSDKSNYGEGISFITPGDIDDNILVKTTKATLTASGLKKTRVIPPNSVCVVCIGSTIGKVAISVVESATNQQINSRAPRKIAVSSHGRTLPGYEKSLHN